MSLFFFFSKAREYQNTQKQIENSIIKMKNQHLEFLFPFSLFFDIYLLLLFLFSEFVPVRVAWSLQSNGMSNTKHKNYL
jgi:hypothetical protein